jgi:hypothetical protein
MKKFLFFVPALVLGCQSADPDTAVTNASQVGSPVTRSNHLAEEPMLNIPADGTLKPSDRNIQKMRDYFVSMEGLKAKSDKLAPFPLPSNDGTLPMAQHEADRNYRAVVARYVNDPVLPLIQQRYARIMLRNYGVLKSGTPAAIAYYTDQLITGKSLDLTLMADGLEIIQGKIDPTEQHGLLRKAILHVSKRQEMAEAFAERLDKVIESKGPETRLRNWDYVQLMSWKETKQRFVNEHAAKTLTRLQKLLPE